jgi:hypothetical protein
LTIPRKFKIQGYCVSFVNVGINPASIAAERELEVQSISRW